MENSGFKQISGGGGDDEEFFNDEKKRKSNFASFHISTNRSIYSIRDELLDLCEKRRQKELVEFKKGVSMHKYAIAHIFVSLFFSEETASRRACAVRILLDEGWKDAFLVLLQDIYKKSNKFPPELISSFISEFEKDPEKVYSILDSLLLSLDNYAVVAFISQLGNEDIILRFSDYLKLMALEDVNENKKNAVLALLCIAEKSSKARSAISSLLNSRSREDTLIALECLIENGSSSTVRIFERDIRMVSTKSDEELSRMARMLLALLR